MHLLQIFSPGLWLFFSSASIVFRKAECFIWLSPAYQLFPSWTRTSVLLLKRHCIQDYLGCLLRCLLGGWVLTHFTFRSRIHFRLSSLKAGRLLEGLRVPSVFFHVSVQLFQPWLLTRLSLLYCLTFAPFQRSGDSNSGVYFRTPHSVALAYLFSHQDHTVFFKIFLFQCS